MADRIGYNGADKWKLKATELLNEGGGGGTDDYEDLENKPSINGVELSGNKTAAQLGMYTKSEVDTSLANKMDLNATNGSISNLNILGNYGIGNVENGGCVYITGSQNKYLDNTFFPEIAIASYDSVNDEYHQIVSMSRFGLLVTTGFSYNCYKGEGAVRGIDVSIEDHLLCIKEGVSDTNIIKVDNTRNIDVNADRVDFNSDYMVFAYAEDGFSFSSDDDFEIDAVGIKIASDGITKSRALYVDSNGYLVSSAATDTELGYLSGVTSNIQTQLDGKQASITGGATTIVSSNLTASRALVSNSSGKVAVSAVTSTELGYLDGVTSAIQTQLDDKLPLAGGTLTGALTTKSITTNGTNLITSSLDTETTPSSTKYSNLLGMTDKNNKYLMYMRGWLTSAGLYGFQIRANRYITDTDYSNYFSLCIDASGNRSVSFSHPAAWRTGLGLGSAAEEDADTAATANTVVKRTANKYVYASYFNTSAGSENPASYTAYPAFISSDGFLRRSTAANFKTFLGIGSASRASGTFTAVTSASNMSFTSGSWYKIGNILYVAVRAKFTSARAVGSGGSFKLSSFPSGGLSDVRTAAWDGSSGLLAGLETNGTMTVRVVGAQAAANSDSWYYFVMPCSN